MNTKTVALIYSFILSDIDEVIVQPNYYVFCIYIYRNYYLAIYCLPFRINGHG